MQDLYYRGPTTRKEMVQVHMDVHVEFYVVYLESEQLVGTIRS